MSVGAVIKGHDWNTGFWFGLFGFFPPASSRGPVVLWPICCYSLKAGTLPFLQMDRRAGWREIGTSDVSVSGFCNLDLQIKVSTYTNGL